jgi:threonylcarbamoyladenosine tRNA methylthiotransferase CDKAL1
MRVFIKGLNSCVMRRGKLLQYERWLRQWGHTIVANSAEADRILVWSCGFRGDVRDSSLKRISQFERDHPNTQVITAGCLPDIDRVRVRTAISGPLVSWKNDFVELWKIFGQDYSQTKYSEDNPLFVEAKLCDNAAKYRCEHPGDDVQFHDEFIKLLVSEGCGHACTYCSERLAFPEFRSFSPALLITQAYQMINVTGETKIVLVADSLGEYGSDIGSSLPDLIRKLCAIAPGVRVALNNLNPLDFIEMFDDMEDLIKSGMLVHINLPIQSASNRVLARMNRGYRLADLKRIFTLFLQENFLCFDTHVILGFPGEDEIDYLATESFIMRYRPSYVLASQYMEAPNLPAVYLDKHCSPDVVDQRSSRFFFESERCGIICNVERGEIMQERLKRINVN